MQNINLYDPALRLQRDWFGADSAAAAVAGALLTIALGTGYARFEVSRLQAPARESSAALQDRQAAMQALARQVEALRPNAALLAEVAAAQSTLQQRQAALQMLRGGDLGDTEGHAATLTAFARQSIDGLWLTGLVLHGRDLALRGRALNPELIPAYVGRLNQEPALQGRAFRALDITRPADEATLPAPGTAPAAARLAPYVEFALAGSNGSVVQHAEGKP